ncbi:MAG: PAS domain S-box protein [Verrucomicrobia bacterium]|nr:PAS domain S-box protein [Verrucomicrobiota bacterium]
MHLVIWFQQTNQFAYLLFSVITASVAAIAICELVLMSAQTPQEYGRVMWWAHIPIFCLVVSTVGFVRFYFNAGRWWLGVTASGLRLLDLIMNFFATPNLDYKEITSLRHLTIFGGETISVAKGVENPWIKVSELSSLFLLVFVADASVTLWRRGNPGERRRAVVVGGAVIFFILTAAGFSALIEAGRIKAPYLISLPFLAIVVAMGYELSSDVVRAARLARQLRASEAASRESEERFRILADTAPVMVWMSGTDMLCSFFNKPWLVFTGRTMEQELGNGWAEGIHRDDVKRCLETYIGSFNARQSFTMEYRLRRADGDYRWVLDTGVPRYLPAGEFAGYIGSVLDITERRLAEERFRLVVEAAPNAMIIVDTEGKISLINPQVESVFGYSQEELVGQPVEMLIPNSFRSEHPNYRQGYFAEPQVRTMGVGREVFGRRKDGREVPIEIGLSPLHTSAGLFALASILDITERRRNELESARQRNDLAHLSRVALLGELSVSLAHELNQPLTAILSNAEAAELLLAQDAADAGDELPQILREIVSESKRAGEVIRRLRVLLKKGDIRRVPLDMNELVQNVFKLIRSDLINQHIAVQLELAPHLPLVDGDEVQLQQVLINLVINACDAMAEVAANGRRLLVSTDFAGESKVRVSVTDEGYGIPPEKIEHIFDPFFTTKEIGTGLGLAVCRSIISAHSGELTAINNPQCGATFQFTVPASEKDTE